MKDLIAAGTDWHKRLQLLQPKNIVELGTGQGATGAYIMKALAPDAKFTTINYIDGHIFGEQLEPWKDDPRLTRISADTIDPKTLKLVPDGIDLLFIDTTHEAWHAAAELRLWQYRLRYRAIVVIDDLDQNDMIEFWQSLPYEKAIVSNQGIFCYYVTMQYIRAFIRPAYTTYGPKN